MKQKIQKPLYLHLRGQTYSFLSFDDTDSVWTGPGHTYATTKGTLVDNRVYQYRLEFISVSSSYNAVLAKIIDGPDANLIGFNIHLDGHVFDDLLRTGQIHCTGSSTELVENLYFKTKGVIKLCRP